MNADVITSVSATIGGGLFGAVVVGLFIAGLAYLQYQQIAYFVWNRIEGLLALMLGNISSQISNGQEAALALSNFGIPLTSSMSAGFAIGFMRG